MKTELRATTFQLRYFPTDYVVPEIDSYYKEIESVKQQQEVIVPEKRKPFEEAIVEYAAVRLW